MAEKEKLGIKALAAEMGVEAATARLALRKHKIKKTGKIYAWDSPKQLKEMAAKLKTEKKDNSKSKKKAA